MSIATPRRSRLDPSGPAALRATRPDRAAAIRGGSPARLRRTLENLRLEAQRARRIDRDPLRLVLAYATPGDREVAGLLAALLAYGRVDLLAAHTRTVLGYLGGRPARRLRRGVPQLPPLSYRFHETRDLLALLRGVRALLLRHGSLGEAFGLRWRREADLRKALAGFADELRAESGPAGPGLRFLLADPARGGACKRWHLFLRWMARSAPGDPDTGIWNGILPQSVLLVPLDTHIVRVGRRLGLTARRTVDWKMAEEITASLRRCDPLDPVRYDFSLCHLGIAGTCPPHLTRSACAACPLRSVCPTGRRTGSRARRRLPKGGAGPP